MKRTICLGCDSSSPKEVEGEVAATLLETQEPSGPTNPVGLSEWYAEVANLILQAAIETLEGMVGISVNRGRPWFQRTAYTEDDITVAISVDGNLTGLILLGFNYRTAFHLLQTMLGEELNTNLPLSDFLQESELAQSALRELANILAGRAATHLETAGYSCVISLPELLMQRGVLLSIYDFWQLIIPLHSEVGDLRLGVTFTAKEEQGAVKFSSFIAQQIVQPQRSIIRCDFTNPDSLGRTAYLLVQQVHERYQHIVRQQVAVHCRLPLNLLPPRLEKDTFVNFLQRDYQWSVAATFTVKTPAGSNLWILALSQSLALLLIDRWLGGPGKPVAMERQEWTPIERSIACRILALFGDAYAEAWRSLCPSLSLHFGQLFIGDLSDQAAALLGSGGALLISHRFQVREETGILQWLLPAESLSQLGAKRSRSVSPKPINPSPLAAQMSLTLRCGWQGQPLSLSQVAQLQVGTILPLRGPCLIWCNGRLVGIGQPFRKNGRLVVKILQWRANPLSLTAATEPQNGRRGSKGEESTVEPTLVR